MKKLVVTLIVAAALTTTLTYAEAPATSSTTPSVKPVVEVGNKICPVSGEKVPGPGEKGAMGEAVKYEYNAKLYNLCCNMCIKDFKKDPDCRRGSS